MQLRTSGKCQQAADSFVQMLKTHPTNTLYLLHMAECYVVLGQSDKAIDACNKVIAIDPHLTWTYDLRANGYMQKKNYKAALADANKEIELIPKSIAGFTLRAWIYQQMNEPQLAMADSDKAVKMAPNEPVTYFYRAQRFCDQGANERAIADCKTSLRLNPKFWDAFSLMIMAYCRLHQSDKALSEIYRAQKLKLFEPLKLATICTEFGLYTEALAQFDIAAEDPKNKEAVHMGKSDCYTKLLQPELGVQEASAAIKLNPKNPDAYASRARCETALHQVNQAIADFNKAIELHSSDRNVYLDLAIFELQQKRYRPAVKDFTGAIAHGCITATNIYTNRAKCYWELCETDAAYKDAQRALAIDKNYVDALHVCVWVLLKQKNYKDALKQAQRVVQLAPKNGKSYALTASVYQAMGDQKSRIEALKKQIEFSPENMEAQIALSDAQSAYGQSMKKPANAQNKNSKLNLTQLDADVKKDGKSAAAYMARASFYSLDLDPTRAISDYTEALKRAPELQAAYLGRGNCYMQLEKWQLAHADLVHAQQLSPADYDTVRLLGELDQIMGLDSQAVADYSKFLAVRKHAVIYCNRAQILCRQNKLKEALADAEAAIQIAPEDSITFATRGDVEMQMHEYGRAVSDYTSAIRFKREDANMYRRRAAAYNKLGNTAMRDRDLAAAADTAKEFYDDAPFRSKSPQK